MLGSKLPYCIRNHQNPQLTVPCVAYQLLSPGDYIIGKKRVTVPVFRRRSWSNIGIRACNAHKWDSGYHSCLRLPNSQLWPSRVSGGGTLVRTTVTGAHVQEDDPTNEAYASPRWPRIVALAGRKLGSVTEYGKKGRRH